MSISFGSINTGLPKDIVQQLMAAERRPLQDMEIRKAKQGERLKLVQELQGHIQGIQGSMREMSTYKAFRDLKASSSDPNAVDVRVDKSLADPGEYQFEVVQMAKRSSAVSNGFADEDRTEVGVGYITFRMPDGEKRSLFIDGNSNTLQGMAKKINENSASLGIKAQVINDGKDSETPYRLMFTGLQRGADNVIKWPEFYFLDGEQDFFIEMEKPGQNAIVNVDGFPVEFQDNTIKDFIPGVTLSLKKVTEGQEFTVSVTEDLEAVGGKIKNLVDNINKVLGFINKQNQMNAETDTSMTLGGDSTLKMIENKIRRLVLTPIRTDAGDVRLSDLGIRFERSGLLTFQEELFDKQLADGFAKIARAFIGTATNPGFFGSLKQAVDGMVGGQGSMLGMKADNFQKRMKDIDRQIDNRERVLERKEVQLKDQFSRLESAMAKLKSQQVAVGTGGQGATQLLG